MPAGKSGPRNLRKQPLAWHSSRNTTGPYFRLTCGISYPWMFFVSKDLVDSSISDDTTHQSQAWGVGRFTSVYKEQLPNSSVSPLLGIFNPLATIVLAIFQPSASQDPIALAFAAHKPVTMAFPCWLCGKTYATKRGAERHWQIEILKTNNCKHCGITLKVAELRPSHSCEKCATTCRRCDGKPTFLSQGAAARHKNEACHWDSRMFCEECGLEVIPGAWVG